MIKPIRTLLLILCLLFFVIPIGNTIGFVSFRNHILLLKRIIICKFVILQSDQRLLLIYHIKIVHWSSMVVCGSPFKAVFNNGKKGWKCFDQSKNRTKYRVWICIKNFLLNFTLEYRKFKNNPNWYENNHTSDETKIKDAIAIS